LIAQLGDFKQVKSGIKRQMGYNLNMVRCYYQYQMIECEITRLFVGFTSVKAASTKVCHIKVSKPTVFIRYSKQYSKEFTNLEGCDHVKQV
jgi:hypothetical protein